MNTDPISIILYIFGIFVLYIICRIFIKPIKWLIKLSFSCAIGCGAMLLANRLLSPLGVNFAINPISAMISGVLGIPGMIMTHLLCGIL